MIYEYKCLDCGQVNEFWMKMSDPSPCECPSCKGARLERLISKTSFALKGAGWYTTDYKKSSTVGGTATKSETPEAAATSGGSCCSGSSCSHKGS